MKDLETLTVKDLMEILKLSRVSVYRRLKEARAGRGGLPLPIPTGTKRSLRWNTEDVRKFLQNANETHKTPPTQEIESAAKRAARNRAALHELKKLGIKISAQKSTGEQ
jgi:predicted DNA-binding transcriptional regulator AlpA